ncbi:hypothetical protein STENO_004091 [Stenotrophomonas maltophilia]
MGNLCVLQTQGCARIGQGDIGAGSAADQVCRLQMHCAARPTRQDCIGIGSFGNHASSQEVDEATCTGDQSMRPLTTGGDLAHTHACRGGVHFDAMTVHALRIDAHVFGTQLCAILHRHAGSTVARRRDLRIFRQIDGGAAALQPDSSRARTCGAQHNPTRGFNAAAVKRVEHVTCGVTGQHRLGGVVFARRRFLQITVGHDLLGTGRGSEDKCSSQGSGQGMAKRERDRHGGISRRAHSLPSCPLHFHRNACNGDCVRMSHLTAMSTQPP